MTYSVGEAPIMDRIDACMNVIETLELLTERAGVNFEDFMSDKWMIFTKSDAMISVQTLPFEEIIDIFCMDSQTAPTKAMLNYKLQLERM